MPPVVQVGRLLLCHLRQHIQVEKASSVKDSGLLPEFSLICFRSLKQP